MSQLPLMYVSSFHVSKLEFNFMLVFVIIYYCFSYKEANPGVSENLNYFTPSALPFFFGVAVFDFEGNNIILNLHSSMKEP